ncbi:hypothetical protein N8Z10_00620 [bacterium]|nr:hypothetical protein [bacterium]
MNEQALEHIAKSLERIAICMENKQAREININMKERKNVKLNTPPKTPHTKAPSSK